MSYIKRVKRKRTLPSKWSITAWLIAINIAVYLFFKIYLLINAIDQNADPAILNYFAIIPQHVMQAKFLSSILLHMFSHVFLFHLLVNMFVLYSLGTLCERIIGRKRYIWFYLIAGVFAGILSVLAAYFLGSTDPATFAYRIFGSEEVAMLGASGAIFAIAGLYMILLPRLKFMIIFLPFFSLPAYIMIPIVLFGFWIITAFTGAPIGNVAHFGGFLAGVIYGLYLKKKYKRKVERLQRMFR